MPVDVSKLDPEIATLYKAAEAGDAQAQFEIATMYALSHYGFEKDMYLAVYWVKKAAEQEHPEAMTAYGTQLSLGEGVTRDMELAKKYLTKAAEKGIDRAMHNLADCYKKEGNAPLAVKWLKQAAETGYALSQYVYASYILDGYGGLAKDEATALNWLQKAADQNHADAIRKLSLLKSQGVKLPDSSTTTQSTVPVKPAIQNTDDISKRQKELIQSVIITLKTNITNSVERKTTWYTDNKTKKLAAVYAWLSSNELTNPPLILGILRDICSEHRHHVFLGGFGQTKSSKEFSTWFTSTFQKEFPDIKLPKVHMKPEDLKDSASIEELLMKGTNASNNIQIR